MRSRAGQQGALGLLILVSLGLFSGMVLWLTGAQFGKRTYSFTVEFGNANGMKIGSSVLYRGVGVGRITAIRTSSNGIEVNIEIAQSNLVMGRDSTIEANQIGLLGETSVAITPAGNLPSESLNLDPLAGNCNGQVIICNGSRIVGDVGLNVNQLLRGTQKFSNLYTSPEFFENINTLAKNASEAAAGVSKLTREFSTITGDIRVFANNANSLAVNANRTVDAVTIASFATAQSAAQIGNTAEQFEANSIQLNQLLTNVNGLVSENRGTLVTTLNDLSQTSNALRSTVVELRPALSQFTSGQILQNLETLSANAAEASRNLRDVSGAVNNPTNLVVLQQTLDAARVTFDNVQKITADLDELTGDPQFRNNLRQLVNGLGNLVSSSQQIQQQVQVAQQLQQIAPNPANTLANPTNPIALTTAPNLLANSSTFAIPALTPTPTPSSPLRGTTPQLANNYQVLPRRESNFNLNPNTPNQTP